LLSRFLSPATFIIKTLNFVFGLTPDLKTIFPVPFKFFILSSVVTT